MSVLTHQQVASALGSVDDQIIAEILATGATAEEFVRARAWLANDDTLIMAGDPLETAAVAQVIALLEAAEESLSQDEGGGPAPSATPPY
jgi:hypothetical protein